MIHARSTEADGSYSWFKSLHQQGRGPYVYARGGNMACLRGDGEVWATSETNNAAATVVSYFVSMLSFFFLSSTPILNPNEG